MDSKTADVALQVIDKYTFAELKDGIPQKLTPQDAAEAAAQIYAIIFRTVAEAHKREI